jgi:DNA-binding NarL/FixJ family response regulator
LLDAFARETTPAQVNQDHEQPPNNLLSEREMEVLTSLAAGHTNPQIAARLVLGTSTVKTHTLNIYRKLGDNNRTQALLRAKELGVI